MKNFEFYNPTKIIFGKNTIRYLGKEIDQFGIKRVLLIYGRNSIFKCGAYEQVVTSLKKYGIEFIEFGGIKPNPLLSQVNAAIKIARNEKVEAILGVGGGSVIDSAKVVAAGVFYKGDIWEVFEGEGTIEKALPVFTVLTISGTGTEMDPWAVITHDTEKKKWPFPYFPTSFPKVSIIDPMLQFTLPKEQTVYGAIDAMSHVFEYYFNNKLEANITDEIAEAILRNIMTNVRVAIKEPENYSSRAELAWSSTLALNGLLSCGRGEGDWSSHTIEHTLSALYDIAHGAGLAIITPAWMKYIYKEALERFVRFAERVFNIIEGDKEEKAIKGIEALQSFYREIGAPISLREAEIPEKDIPKIVENASLRTPIGTLKKLNKEDIERIIKLAL